MATTNSFPRFALPLFALVVATLAPLASTLHAQQAAPKAEPRVDPSAELHTFRLWEKAAPGALGDNPEDIPTLTLYPVGHHDKSGPAIIVAPGGSYHFLAANHEGRQIANFFNAMGITAFVLEYRL